MQQRILDQVESQLLAYGYKGLRVDEIARAAAISKRTLYELFWTREDMAREALARRLARVEQAIAEVAGGSAASSDQLREILTLICQADAEGSPAFHRDLQTTPALAELVVASRRRSVAKLDAVIRLGIQHGRFRGDLDARLVRRTLLAAVAEIVQPRASSPPRRSVGQAVDAVLDLVLHGVAAV